MAETSHARLGPSSADRWMACAASIRMSQGLPDKPSKYAEEGTRAHAALEDALSRGVAIPDEALCDDATMVAHVTSAITAVMDAMAQFADIERFETERRVYPVRGRGDIHGTADVIISGRLHDGRRCVQILDLKYGANHMVSEASPQLAIYGLGAAEEIGGLVDVFRTTVIQPRLRFRAEPVRTKDRDRAEMLAFLGAVRRAAAATDDSNAPAVAGAHCLFCKAKDTCQAYAMRPASNSVKATFEFA
jgi:hypothetical protein